MIALYIHKAFCNPWRGRGKEPSWETRRVKPVASFAAHQSNRQLQCEGRRENEHTRWGKEGGGQARPGHFLRVQSCLLRSKPLKIKGVYFQEDMDRTQSHTCLHRRKPPYSQWRLLLGKRGWYFSLRSQSYECLLRSNVHYRQ